MPNLSTIVPKFAKLFHAPRHEKDGPDQITVAGLSGHLSDEQDAGKIKGVIIDDSAIADGKVLTYIAASGNVEYI